MALVNIANIIVEENPASFLAPLKFKITFEVVKEIQDEIEWQLIYIGSAKDEKYDQILDSFSMGPLSAGIMQFVLETNAPDPKKIPSKDDLLGVTAIVLTVSYQKKEFFRCGYYVYNSYTDQELIDSDPETVIIEKVQRNILADKPRITRFDIDWGNNENFKNLEKENEIALQDENLKKETMLNDKTNLADMKNNMFGDLDKKSLESNFQMNLQISTTTSQEKNPFLE